eukprot:4164885-Karenia_brevis.AAC.1
MPSVDCLLARARLNHLVLVMKAPSDTLRTLLATRSAGGMRLPWVDMVIRDMRDLKQFHANRLAELGDPVACWSDWSKLITDYTSEWKMLVKEFTFTASAVDRKGSK